MRATLKPTPVFLAIMTALAVNANAHADTTNTATVDTGAVSIMGEGQVRSSNAVDHKEFQQQQPGRDPVMALERVPGVNVTTADPYGIYEYGSDIEMRGFNSSQIGVTVDGVPMTSNAAAGGNPAGRFMDSENLESATVAQGSGDLSTPSYNALGGSISYQTIDPKNKPGLQGEISGGSFNSHREFLRLDTGNFADGTKAYVSGSRTDTEKWRGKGKNTRNHFETKIQKVFGENKVGMSYTYNKRFDHDYLDMSLADYNKYGRSYDLNTTWTGDPLKDQNNYTGWTNGRTDQLLSFQGDFKLTDRARLSLVPYYQKQEGFGTYNPGHNPITGAVQLMFRESRYFTDRYGVTSKLTYDLGPHQLSAGVWLERYKYRNDRNWYNTLDQSVSGAPDLSTVVKTDFNREFLTNSATFYVQDTITMMDDRLKLDVGAKAISVSRDYTDILNATAGRSAKYSKSFLPQIGATYQLTANEQIFGNYAKNFSAPSTSVLTVGTYNPDLKPESSTNVDLGIRTKRQDFDASLAVYHVKYDNRILQIKDSTNRYLLNADIFSNVGSITSKGVELASNWHPVERFNLYTALTLNQSKFDQNYQASATSLVQSAGKTVPDSPKAMLFADASYNVSGYFAGINGKYVGQRYSTVDNTESAPAYTVFGLRAGYKVKKFYGMNDFRVQLNVENIFDKSYLSSMYTGTTAGNPTYFTGTPRSVYLTIGGSI
ncbi:MAG: TonB-dependent receptor family protein [Halothiobacillus sp.]